MALDLTYDPNWKPDSKSGDVDLTYDPNWKPQGILGGLGSSLKRGIDSTVDYGKISLTDNPDEIAGIVSENIRNRPQPSAAQQKMNAEIAPYAKEASDAQGIVGNIGAYAKLYGKRAMQLAENPREFAGMVAENLPNSAPGIAGMVAGGAAGAATPVPFGAAIGGVVGGTAGGYKIEQGSSMFDQVVKEAQARGIDTNNKPAMSAMIAEKYPEFLKASQLKGVGTAGTDAVLNVATLGVAGIGERALAREARSVADLAKAGKMTGEEAASAIAGIEAKNAARNTIGQKALRGAGVAAGEMAGESLSEAAGQQLAYGKLDPLDVVDEGLLAFGQGVGMAAGRKFISPLVGATDKDSVTQEIERARAFATALNQSVGGDVNAVPTLITDLGPLQQRIDDLHGIGNARMNDAERAKYEQEFNAAFGEVVGYTTDKDGMEIPFTMGDYLNSQVRSADITRDRPKAANAVQQSESRLQQVADEETTGYVAPEIPVVGTLSAVANMAIKSGAHAQNQMQQAMQAALAKQGKPEKANGPIAAATDAQVATQGAQGAGGNVPGSAGASPSALAGNQERAGNGAEVAAHGLRPAVSAGIAGVPAGQLTPEVSRAAQPSQVAAQAAQANGPQARSEQAAAQASAFDVSQRTNGQLSYLASNGQPGWKEAAVAELQKRGVQVSAPQQAKSDTLSAEKPANSATVPAQKAEDSAKTPAAPVEVNVEVRQNQKAKGEKLIFINGEQVGVVSRARSPGTSDWGFRGSLSGELHFTEEKAVAAETEAAKKHYSNRIKVAAMEAEMPPAAETKPKPENKKPTEPPTFWTSSTPAHRKWIMDASGMKQYTAMTPWNRIKPEHQALLIEQWGDKPANQNPIKNEDPAAATGPSETNAANQEPIKKDAAVEAGIKQDSALEKRVLIAADSIDKLRKVDVERVLTQGNIDRQQMAEYIKRKRPDLSGEVDDVMAELQPSVSQPKTDAATEAKQDKASLFKELRSKLDGLAERAMNAGDGAMSGRFRGFTIGMKEDDSNLTREWVDEVLSDREKMVVRLENKASSKSANSKPDEDTRFAKNTIFTADKVAAAKARMKAKLGTMNSGIDPELLIDGMTVAGAYIESGVRKFGDYAKAMVEDLGDGVKPYLLSFYEAARAYPGLNKMGMDTQEEAAKQHQAMLTPEVKEAAKEVIGESPKVEKKKPANLGEAVRLKADWGVQNIDGYTRSKTGKNQETDYGLKGGIKDEFLADAKRYLTAVSKLLEAQGFAAQNDSKGKPFKVVTIGEGGPAVGGDVYLRMSKGGFEAFAQVGVTNVRGIGPAHPQGVSLMTRAGERMGMNNWLATDLSAGDLAGWFDKQYQAFAKRGAEVNAEAPSSKSYDMSKTDDKFKVATEIADFLIGGGEFKTIIEARKKISEIIGRTIDAATELAKQADETIEAAVVVAGREIVKAGRAQKRGSEVIYDRLVDLYRRQPNLAVRSSTSVRDQAYSTPVPLSFLASELAGITNDTTVLEPTAGNGMLLVGASLENSIANELNQNRVDMLRAIGFDATQKNAATGDLVPEGKKVDAVIANPPFGATKDANGETIVYEVKPGFDTREVDHAIAFKALAQMKDDGRAVLIVGGVMSESDDARREDYRGKNKRTFYYNLYNDYNVIDHFTVDGDLYSKQGASYPVDVIVISGRGKSSRDLPAAELPKIIKSYDALKEKLNEENRMATQGGIPAGTGRGDAADRPGERVGVAGSAVGQGNGDGDQGSAKRSDAGVQNAGTSGNTESDGGRAVSRRWELESTGTPVGMDGNAVPGKNGKTRSGTDVGNAGNGSAELGGTSIVDGQRVESGLADRRGGEQETENQVAYSPKSGGASVGTLVPKAMRDAIESSLNRAADSVGDIDQYVAESLDMDVDAVRKNFSAEQIDALALSIRNAVAGKGFIIGDQTGIGKGRVVAAMIRYALVNGKVPIFVTEKPNLYSDMIRDLDDIGMTNDLALDTKKPKILITNGSESVPYALLRNVDGEIVENNLTLKSPKSGKALDDLMREMVSNDSLGEYKVIFTTYSQLQTVKGNETMRQRFVKHFGASNYMVFDESHNAGGAGETQARTKEQRQAAKDGESLVTGRASFVRNLVQKAFGTFFSSATYAKRPDVMDLYSSTNMKLAVDRISQLGEAIKSGGVPMQQVVANMLTNDGQYIRRERTFAGVAYDTVETAVDRGTAENMANAMRSILAFSRKKEAVIKSMQKELDREGAMLAAVGGEKTSVQGANFGSIMHNLIDQMLLSLKAQSSVNHAIARLKSGEKVVMTVSNTMGSFLQSYADDLGLSVGDQVSLSFSDLYERYLEKQRMVSIKSGSGEKKQHRLTDAELGPELVAMYGAIRKQISESGFGSAPISPIDFMHSELRKAGYKTDEITGRTVSLNYGDNGSVSLASRSSSIKQRVGAVSAFNNGSVDVLILNQAGSTGLSLHASSNVKDKRKRHMIIVQAEKNIDTHMQMLGRVHRTGQVVAPAYSQMMADVPAEMRPASVLLKKMASLNANTTASRKSSVTAEGVVDFMNDYGGQVVHEYLRDNPDVLEAVGGSDVLKLTDDSADATEEDIRKFTGYIPVLPIKQQEEIYRELTDRYNDLIERENSLGTNKLEAKAVDLDAETISSVPVTENKDSESVFATPANMEKVDVKRSVKPYSSEEVAELVKDNLGGKTAREFSSAQITGIREKAQEFARARIEKLKEDGADPVRIDMTKNQLQAVFSHTNSILSTFKIGDTVSIKDANGQFMYGAITNIASSGKAANPAAGSVWKMTFALANGDAKSITLNFSQIGSKYEVRQIDIADWYNIETQSAERVPVMSLFDRGANVRREKRWIVTGNILAGFARFPGQIITYTKKDGTNGQGILMSRQFDFEKEMKNAPVTIKTGADAVAVLDGIGRGAAVGTKDRVFRIENRGNRYEVTAPSSKKDGGTYYLDYGITGIIGDFYKRGSTMSATVYDRDQVSRLVDYVTNDRQEAIVVMSNPDQAKQILGIDQKAAGNIATPATISPADKAIYGMAAEGKSASDILKFIASASRSPFNRQVAKLLLKTGLSTKVTVGDGKGWKMNAGEGNKYAAGYNPKTDTVALFRPAAAERNMLHELIHAATLKALDKNGLSSGQMKALYKHVKKTGKLKGMYGMSDIDEFVAEAFTNPKFQDRLKSVSAPAGGNKLATAWDWFVRVVRGILGLKQGQDNALSRALEIGLGVMREDMALRKGESSIPFAEITGNEIDKVLGRNVQERARNWMKINLQGKSFKNDATGWDISVGRKGISKSMMHAAKDVHSRSVAAIPALLKNAVLVASEQNRDEVERLSVPLVHHFYAPLRLSGNDYIARIVVKETSSGQRFYDFDTSNEISPAGSSDAYAVLSKQGAVSDKARLNMSMSELLSYVKAEHGGADPRFVRYNVSDDGWSVSEPSKMDDVIYALQDKQIDMKRVVQSIMRTGKKVKDEVNAYLQEELFHGRAAKGVKDFLDFELRPLLKQMQDAKVDMGDFEEYLWNRHAEERNKQIAKINPDMPDGGSGIETAKARAYLAGLSAEQRKTFEALAAKVEAMNRESQRVLVESGLEKQSTIDSWNGAYKHYVPLQREDVDSGHVGTGKGFSVRGSSSKRAMGSGKKVVDIIANLTMQRERNIVRAEKNRVSNALLGLAVQNPNPDFWKVDQAPKERVVQEKAIYTVLDSDGNKIEEFTRMDEAERLANKTPGAIIDQTWGDRVTERVMPGFTSRDNVLLTRINGEDHYVIFNERDERAMRMAAAMKNLDMDNLGRVLSVVGKATRYLASINTQYNPVFGVINLIRDAQGALINLSSTPLAGEQKRVLGYTKDALVGIYKDIRAHRSGAKPSSNWAALFEEFQKEGGQTGYRDQYANAEARAESIKSELEQFKDGKAKQLARGVFGWLSDYNETMENAVRLAAYKAAKEKGMSNQQAASLAKNITVNFNRKGQMATQVGALYAFFNASVQGTARIAETLFDQNGGDIKNVRLSKKGKQILAGGIMLGAMQALLLAAAGFDDDEPPEFIRARNLILPIGGGKYLTLAMPLGLHVIPGIGRIATEFVLSGGKDPLKRIAAFGSMFADAFNPIGSAGWSLQTITPSVVDPFAALAENKDFTGKEIYREDFNKLNPTPGHARAKDVATIWSRYISEALNFMTGGTEFKPGMFSPSPDSIDYLIAQAGGGVMREANKVAQTVGATATGEDLPLYKIPLVGRFVGDTAGQSGQSAKFYDAIKQINMHEAQYKGLIKDGRSAEAREYLAENPAVRLIMAGNHAELAVRKLRTMKRDLVENDADQDKIRAIDARITETMRRFNERAGAFI